MTIRDFFFSSTLKQPFGEKIFENSPEVKLYLETPVQKKRPINLEVAHSKRKGEREREKKERTNQGDYRI